MNGAQSRLMTELSRLFGNSERANARVMEILENPQWESTNGRHDWRRYIPEDVQDLWLELPLEAHMVALLMAEAQANLEEWE